mmetsp:Transcript_38598/g.27917  ORF Transcript_38598/g.27917 Transcript_38598/m.27917 type:complete len:369 (-) Transcript_38598:349-1455(-)
MIRDGTLLHEVLIDTDEGDGVTARNISDSFGLTTHHNDGSLDVLDVKIRLGTGLVVGSHNSDLLTSGDGTGEDTTEGVESTLVVGGDHLGDEDHKRTVLITVLDGLTARIINGSFVKVSSSIGLGFLGGRKFEDNHFNESISGVDPFLVDALEEILSSLLLLFGLENNTEVINHLESSFNLVIHDHSTKHDNGSHDELDETSWELLAIITGIVGGEFLGSRVEVVITPQSLHKLGSLELELLRVDLGEFGKGKGPTEEGGTKSSSTFSGINLLVITHIITLVGGNDNVNVLNDTLEVLVHSLTIDLEFEDTTIDLVNHEYASNLFGKSLTEDGLGLYGHTFDVINNDKSTISNSEGSSDLRGEINVTW